MNFKLKLYSWCLPLEAIPATAYLVIADDTEEVMYLGTIRDYSIAQEIVRRWNEYAEKTL